MAAATFCVSCAALPIKDRHLAMKTVHCPDCQSAFGVTSYGAAFRFEPVKRTRLLSSAFVTGAVIGTGLFVFVLVLTGLGLWSSEKVIRPNPSASEQPPPSELARIQEVAVDDPFPAKVQPANAKLRIQNLIAKIQQENGGANKDAFLVAQMDARKELRGMPFVMGDACRLDMNKAQSFQTSVQAVRNSLETDFHAVAREDHPNRDRGVFWDAYLTHTAGKGIDTDHGIAALAQILGPERLTLRTDLVQRLAQSNRREATRELARAAIFDVNGEVRTAAIKALKTRPPEHSAEVLMHGIRYPMPVVAKRTAQAMIMLDRRDLLPHLVQVLGEPAPGDPEDREVAAGGPNVEKVCMVREVVRINHHRNCLLCHPPSQTGSTQEVPGVIPIPGTPFPSSPSEAYGAAKSQGEPMIRADTTYLRQDFSVLMPVENAAPWPEMQRFDFLVRNRVVEGKELAALQQLVRARPVDFQSENHKAVARVLRELTGQDAAPNQAAWQRIIGAE